MSADGTVAHGHDSHGGHGHGGHGDHGHGGHGDHGHDDGGFHISMGGYVKGFIGAVILTVIPFWLVMGKTFSSSGVTSAVLLSLAAVQVVVHMIYFLHLNPKSEGGWNMLALIFTLMVVVITLSGSLWVMYHMNHNMMPASMMDMKNMP